MRNLSTSSPNFKDTFEVLKNRRHRVLDEYAEEVQRDIRRFRTEGESFLLECARERDGIELKESELWVDPAAIKSAHKLLDSKSRESLERAKERIERFQSELKPTPIQSQEEEGLFWGTCLRPLDRVGIYVPGGRAHYFLTLLLVGIPARMAGVEEIIVATPPKKKLKPVCIDPAVLYSAKLLGISKILLAGSVGGLSALAFGTKNSPPVQKIVASGGARTAVAKTFLSGYVGTEGIAASSETVFVCDKTANIDFVAADILSRADRDSEALICVFHTDDKSLQVLATRMAQGLDEVKDGVSREAIQKCLENNFFCFHSKSVEESIELTNQIAPGTLCLHIKNPMDRMDEVRSCGQLLIGPYSTPIAMDLIGGAVGLTPTLGSADYSISLSPTSFVRRFPFVEVGRSTLDRAGQDCLQIAHAEGLVAADRAITIRLQDS